MAGTKILPARLLTAASMTVDLNMVHSISMSPNMRDVLSEIGPSKQYESWTVSCAMNPMQDQC